MQDSKVFDVVIVEKGNCDEYLKNVEELYSIVKNR